MNIDLLVEQMIFESELMSIVEAIRELNTLVDFAKAAQEDTDEAKELSKNTNDPINLEKLIPLRKQLMAMVSINLHWPGNLSEEEKESRLDKYILNASIDPTLVGLSSGLNLKSLRYLHRGFFRGYRGL